MYPGFRVAPDPVEDECARKPDAHGALRRLRRRHGDRECSDISAVHRPDTQVRGVHDVGVGDPGAGPVEHEVQRRGARDADAALRLLLLALPVAEDAGRLGVVVEQVRQLLAQQPVVVIVRSRLLPAALILLDSGPRRRKRDDAAHVAGVDGHLALGTDEPRANHLRVGVANDGLRDPDDGVDGTGRTHAGVSALPGDATRDVHNAGDVARPDQHGRICSLEGGVSGDDERVTVDLGGRQVDAGQPGRAAAQAYRSGLDLRFGERDDDDARLCVYLERICVYVGAALDGGRHLVEETVEEEGRPRTHSPLAFGARQHGSQQAHQRPTHAAEAQHSDNAPGLHGHGLLAGPEGLILVDLGAFVNVGPADVHHHEDVGGAGRRPVAALRAAFGP